MKSCILDPPPATLLKQHFDLLFTNYPEDCQLVTGIRLFSVFFENCYVSPLLKKANLDHEVLAKYRPISNLKVISKIIDMSSQYVFKNI